MFNIMPTVLSIAFKFGASRDTDRRVFIEISRAAPFRSRSLLVTTLL